jgi:hypothetical protein
MGGRFSTSGHTHGLGGRSFKNAVRIIKPHPVQEHAPSSFDSGGTTLAVDHVETAAVFQLEPFERFVYVMSVLERYSDLDFSLLLGCARRDVIAARIRAFQQIENAIDFRDARSHGISGRYLGRDRAVGAHEDFRHHTPQVS